MKTETEIAKENIKRLDLEAPLNVSAITPVCCTHLASLKRELEFLEGLRGQLYPSHSRIADADDRITDIKQAIKVYKEVGLKWFHRK